MRLKEQKTLDYAKTLYTGRTTPGSYRVSHLTRLPKDASETLKAAFEGKEGTEVISDKKGDIVRAVVPEYKKGRLSQAYC